MEKPPYQGPLKYLLLLAGWLAVIGATLGLVLPLVPTVPFLLLALFCFSRSSLRMRTWLFNNRLLGPYLTNYLQRRGLTKRQLCSSLASLWCGMTIAIMLVSVFAVKWLLVAIGIGVTIHLLSMKRLPEL